jgi:hypothetical protein
LQTGVFINAPSLPSAASPPSIPSAMLNLRFFIPMALSFRCEHKTVTYASRAEYLRPDAHLCGLLGEESRINVSSHVAAGEA